jgi:hypothetical protein
MSDERELQPVEPCKLPVNDPSLKPEGLGKHQCYIRLACHAGGVQYDRREVEEYTHPTAMHVSRFICPKGHLGEDRRIWEPVPPDAGDL